MAIKKIGDRIRWRIEGTLDEVGEGEVVVLFTGPITDKVMRYGVRPDNPHIVFSIVPIEKVIEEAEDD